MKLTIVPLYAVSGRSFMCRRTASAGPATRRTAITDIEIRILINKLLCDPKRTFDKFIVAPFNRDKRPVKSGCLSIVILPQKILYI